MQSHNSLPACVLLPDAGNELARGDVAVQFLTTAEEFAALAPDWNRLHRAAVSASVFNSWIWQYQWWQIYGRGQPLRVLVALEGGRALGVVALYLQTVRVLGVHTRLLRFIGTGGDTHPDDLGPVLAPGREDEIALHLARAALRVSEADAAVLTDIDPRSAFARALERAADELGQPRLSSDCERIAFIELPASWPEFLASLTSDRRTRINGARRKVLASHRARFFVWDDATRLPQAFERLAELHRRRWQAAGGSESFASREYLSFHRRVIESAFARGWLRLYCLELDGEIAAITYCYRFRNRIYLMQAGFDPMKAKCNPGKVLLGYAIEHAIAEGNEVFDFLRGEHRYKEQLASGDRHTRSVWVFRRTLGGLAYRLRRALLPRWKARLLGQPAPKLLP